MIQLSKEDVVVIPVDSVCPNCEDGNARVTHAVSIDFRGAGEMISVSGALCLACASDFAQRIRDTLPEYDPEE